MRQGERKVGIGSRGGSFPKAPSFYHQSFSTSLASILKSWVWVSKTVEQDLSVGIPLRLSVDDRSEGSPVDSQAIDNQTKDNTIRKTIFFMPVNGLWYCTNCKEINPSEKRKCLKCKKDCEFFYVGHSNWIKIGIPSSIFFSLILFESILLYLYINEPTKISLEYVFPIITLSVLSPIVLSIGLIFLCLFIEMNNLPSRVCEKVGGTNRYYPPWNRKIVK